MRKVILLSCLLGCNPDDESSASRIPEPCGDACPEGRWCDGIEGSICPEGVDRPDYCIRTGGRCLPEGDKQWGPYCTASYECPDPEMLCIEHRCFWELEF